VNSFAGAPHHHATILLIWQIDLKPDLAGNDSANTTHIINYICLDNRERLRCDGIESLAAHRWARHHGSIINMAALDINWASPKSTAVAFKEKPEHRAFNKIFFSKCHRNLFLESYDQPDRSTDASLCR